MTTALEPPPTYKGRAMSLLVHADTKVGKTTLGWSTRAPRLILDAEMAYRFMPRGIGITFWDPMTQSPPVYDGTWESCVVLVRNYQVYLRALQWLNSGQHPFVSVFVDSISEIQTQLRDDLTESGRMSQQLWGDLLIQMERTCRQFRDLTENPVRPIEAVVLSAMTQMKEGKWRPYLQGQSQVKTPYYFDICGYLYVEQVNDPNDASVPPRKVRKMLVTPHPQYEAGERVQGRLGGDVVEQPTVIGLLDMVFGALPA